ncbi:MULTISPECIES: hypothetical protein [Saccharothrix]|uniref:ANTAR domain-containing protein n=2 Tax=Saccharothrix TaxID=2071 RepID=A0ABU1PPZ7_9PSEU|nr:MULTISPECIES: hypothetical protein [Saccharothrix]MDR6592737.1 hypothetical protein [Saccharothrix longispora]
MSSSTPLLPPMTAGLEVLKATSDRSDPLDEAVLSVVEAAALAVDAAQRARAGGDLAEVHSCLGEVLGAARAAVTAATFAVVRVRDEMALARVAPPEGRL